MFKEFKEFAIKGSVIDMAVGIIIGAAFTGIVTSLVKDVIMPPIGWVVGSVDFSNLFFVLKYGPKGPAHYAVLKDAQEAGAITVNIGLFLNTLINFLIVSLAIFFLIRSLNKLKRDEVTTLAPSAKDCPCCTMTIPIKATRCPHCTSDLTGR